MNANCDKCYKGQSQGRNAETLKEGSTWLGRRAAGLASVQKWGEPVSSLQSCRKEIGKAETRVVTTGGIKDEQELVT